MALTNTQIIQWIYSKLGSEKDSGIIEPLIIAVADLAYYDLAKFLLDNDSEMAKKLAKSITNQSWSSSKFSAPTDMLFYKQIKTTRLDFGGTLAFQIKDRDKLDMITGVSNHYYALEGKIFYIRHSSGTISGSNLNMTYYKIPNKDDIDDELRNIFLELLLTRLVPQTQNGNSKRK